MSTLYILPRTVREEITVNAYEDEGIANDDSTTFLLSWDMTGIEAVVDISQFEKEAMWDTLQDKSSSGKINSVMGHILMRARANPHRHYEVYTVHIAGIMSEDDVRAMFDSDPQGMADLVRDRGNKIHSNRLNEAYQKIV